MRKSGKNRSASGTEVPRSDKAGAPVGAFIHDEIFESADRAAKAIAASIKFLKSFSSKQADGNGDANKIGFVIENIEVGFQRGIKRLKLQTNFASNLAVIHYPITGKESQSQLRELEVKILNEFLPSIPEAQMRSVLQFYRTLDSTARENLEMNFGSKEVAKILDRLSAGIKKDSSR